jgi:hypothetical protein
MKSLIVGLIFIGSLAMAASVHAQGGRTAVVSVECNGNCNDSTLGQLCRDLAGRTFRPFAVDCQNVEEQDRRNQTVVPCGGNNQCSFPQRNVEPQHALSTYCQDIDGWDANVYCEQVTTLEGTSPFGMGGAGTNTMRITFPSPFTSPPRIQVTPKGENFPFPDVFAVTTRNVTTTAFEVSVFRVDGLGGGWGQNLQIDWSASVTTPDGGVVQLAPAQPCEFGGWGAEVTCALPNIEDPQRIACTRGNNRTFEACQECVTRTINSCRAAGAEENDVFVSLPCQCSGLTFP